MGRTVYNMGRTTYNMGRTVYEFVACQQTALLPGLCKWWYTQLEWGKRENLPPLDCCLPPLILWLRNVQCMLANCVHTCIAGTRNFMPPDHHIEMNLKLIFPPFENLTLHSVVWSPAGPFEWVMAWRDMIPAHHYATILDQHFFPKWIQVSLISRFLHVCKLWQSYQSSKVTNHNIFCSACTGSIIVAQ